MVNGAALVVLDGVEFRPKLKPLVEAALVSEVPKDKPVGAVVEAAGFEGKPKAKPPVLVVAGARDLNGEDVGAPKLGAVVAEVLVGTEPKRGKD